MWIQIDKEYLNYIRDKGDSRVPFQNYGDHKFKPFFPVFTLKDSDITYVANIGHHKQVDLNREDTLDYKKVIGRNGMCLGVIHLNTMIPVPNKYIINYDYSMIEEQLSWGESFDFSRHLPRYLKYEQRIKQADVYKSAVLVYKIKNENLDPNASKRTLDFKGIEAKGIECRINKYLEENKSDFKHVLVEKNDDSFIVKSDDQDIKVSHAELLNFEHFCNVTLMSLDLGDSLSDELEF